MWHKVFITFKTKTCRFLTVFAQYGPSPYYNITSLTIWCKESISTLVHLIVEWMTARTSYTLYYIPLIHKYMTNAHTMTSQVPTNYKSSYNFTCLCFYLILCSKLFLLWNNHHLKSSKSRRKKDKWIWMLSFYFTENTFYVYLWKAYSIQRNSKHSASKRVENPILFIRCYIRL